ncbi:MAG: AI-2E family transporter [Phycisphaerales bacterium]|nr:MAG: AI-2E family transporter [Phycisphaerales bacterium]
MAGSPKRDDGPDSSTRPEETPLSRLHVWHIQAVRDVLVVVCVLAIFWAGYALRAVTVPLLVALLLAYLFEPLIRWLTDHPKLRFSRVKAVSALLTVVGVLVLVALALALPLIVGQTTQFIGHVRDGTMRSRIVKLERFVPEDYQAEFKSILEVLPAGRGAGGRETVRPDEEAPPTEGDAEETSDDASSQADDRRPPIETGDEALTEERAIELFDQRLAEEMDRLRAELAAAQEAGEPAAADDGVRNLADAAKAGMHAILDVLGAIVAIGLLAFLIPFYFFFFSLWYPEVLEFGEKLIPDKNKPRALELLSKMDEVVAGFVRGRIVICLIMGVMLAIGWMICGVPYAIPLGLVVGIFCAVPYLGVIGMPLAIGLLFYGQLGEPVDQRMAWWGVLLWPSVVFGIVQTIEGYVLVPIIAGKATGLDPVTILVVVLAGGSVMGVYGMLLAIPVAACGKILFLEVLLPRIRMWAKGESADPLPLDSE